MKRLSWLSVEDYGTTPLEIMVVSTMKGYLRQMPAQSIIEGAKLAAFIDEAVCGLIGLLFDLLNGKIKIHWGRL